MQDAPAAIERSDVCAVPAAAVVGEAMVVVRARRRVPRKVRRRLDRRDRTAHYARHGRARARAASRLARSATASADPSRPMMRPIRPLRRRRRCTARRTGRRDHAGDRGAHRRHDPDDVRRARHRPRGAAGRRRLRIFVVRHLGRAATRPTCSSFINPEFVERDGMQLEEEGCLSVPGFNATVARPSRAIVKGLDRHGEEQTSKAPGCSPAASSTRWIISTARCSSIVCAACRRT